MGTQKPGVLPKDMAPGLGLSGLPGVAPRTRAHLHRNVPTLRRARRKEAGEGWGGAQVERHCQAMGLCSRDRQVFVEPAWLLTS